MQIIRFYCGDDWEDFKYPDETTRWEFEADLNLWLMKNYPSIDTNDVGFEYLEHYSEDDTFDYGEDALLDYLYIDSKP